MTRLRPVTLPDFGLPVARPAIPAATLAARCDAAYARAGRTWLFVYADREHCANILHFTGFDPRFEEAILLLGPGGRRIVLAGNESASFTAISPLPGLETVLAQSLSLPGQDRSRAPRIEDILREAGLARGDTIGVIGWKYLDPEEWPHEAPAFLVPHYLIATLARIVGGPEGLSDATPMMMNPRDGLRSIVGADQIAAAEWASARASAAVRALVEGARPGQREIEAAASMPYCGEPLSAHVMFSGGDRNQPIHGLASPGGRRLARGDGMTTAVGYRGGLSARAGLLDDSDDAFVAVAAHYFDTLVTWYEVADIGVPGSRLHDAIGARLAQGGLRSALNAGHLVSDDEWSHSPVRPGSDDALASGMIMQVDIIPTGLPAGTALNCEDTVALADAGLRADLAARHPEVWARIEARRAFMRDALGVALKPAILPLSNIPLCLPPLWLAPERLFVAG